MSNMDESINEMIKRANREKMENAAAQAALYAILHHLGGEITVPKEVWKEMFDEVTDPNHKDIYEGWCIDASIDSHRTIKLIKEGEMEGLKKTSPN